MDPLDQWFSTFLVGDPQKIIKHNWRPIDYYYTTKTQVLAGDPKVSARDPPVEKHWFREREIFNKFVIT